MSGLTVQVGPWRNDKTKIVSDKIWSGGGVPSGGRQHAGHGNWRIVMDPSQLSGFTYEKGFPQKPSPYSPTPTRYPVKSSSVVVKTINNNIKPTYLKEILSTLKIQSEYLKQLVDKDSNTPTSPELPKPIDSSTRNLLNEQPSPELNASMQNIVGANPGGFINEIDQINYGSIQPENNFISSEYIKNLLSRLTRYAHDIIFTHGPMDDNSSFDSSDNRSSSTSYHSPANSVVSSRRSSSTSYHSPANSVVSSRRNASTSYHSPTNSVVSSRRNSTEAPPFYFDPNSFIYQGIVYNVDKFKDQLAQGFEEINTLSRTVHELRQYIKNQNHLFATNDERSATLFVNYEEQLAELRERNDRGYEALRLANENNDINSINLQNVALQRNTLIGENLKIRSDIIKLKELLAEKENEVIEMVKFVENLTPTNRSNSVTSMDISGSNYSDNPSLTTNEGSSMMSIDDSPSETLRKTNIRLAKGANHKRSTSGSNYSDNPISSGSSEL